MRTCIAILVFGSITSAQVLSGGSFTIERSVIASGGGSAANGTYFVAATIGQPTGGVTSSGGVFSIQGGFWSDVNLVPTAASVRLSGDVVDASGRPISGAIIMISGDGITAQRVVRTNSFGRYAFEGIRAGGLYIISISHRRYQFEQPVMLLELVDDVTDLRFQAER